jgi:hypothetical protein
VLNNCTLTGNQAIFVAGYGGHIVGGGVYGSTLNNCILMGNSVSDFSGGGSGTGGGNYAGGMLTYCCTTPDPGGIGNITNAPLFVDEANGDLRLQCNSPCINAGDNSYATNATDLDGNPRISGGTVDIGAYEYQWPQLTITPFGVPPSGILLSWPTNNAGYDYAGYTLQSTTNLSSSAVWSTNSPAPVVIGGQNVITNPMFGPQQFYRLSQ